MSYLFAGARVGLSVTVTVILPLLHSPYLLVCSGIATATTFIARDIPRASQNSLNACGVALFIFLVKHHCKYRAASVLT